MKGIEDMNNDIGKKDYIGYEYKDVTVDRKLEGLYLDAYQSFGWMLDKTFGVTTGFGTITLKFKRDRKIRNKAELTRLQRQFDANVNEILSMERSRTDRASIVAFTVGMVGTGFMAGSTFSFLAGSYILCAVLAIPAFIGWFLPYFLYKSTYAKKAKKILPLVDTKYDEIYEICERANNLLNS